MEQKTAEGSRSSRQQSRKEATQIQVVESGSDDEHGNKLAHMESAVESLVGGPSTNGHSVSPRSSGTLFPHDGPRTSSLNKL